MMTHGTNTDCPTRGEAAINRIGDASMKLPDSVRASIPEVPCEDIRANRVLVTHVHHRIDPEVLPESTVAKTLLALATPRSIQPQTRIGRSVPTGRAASQLACWGRPGCDAPEAALPR